ncbi:MAG: hypothetical protein PHY62_06000 [Gallionella sp.]|nr:hypothetical protein [Gallionella sp.]
MAGKFVSRWFYAGLGKYEVEVSAGLLKTKTEERASQRYVDFDGYAEQLTKIYEELDSDGYDVINIVPISMGQSEEMRSKAAYLGEVGFSITRGAVVIGKKREG